MSAPPFAVRGVIEGYWGRPWTHEQRLELIDFVAARGMNVLAHAPKDEPLLRTAWREPYGPDDLERIRELVERTRSSGMELLWCISPGLSIRYADPADVGALHAKIDSVVAVGVRRVGLLFDDIPPRPQDPADRAAFAGLEQAHVSLAETVLASLPGDVELIVCPTKDWGSGTEDSLVELGAGLDRRIDLFWTGRFVCAPTLELVDAETFSRTAQRPPTYWDNYPVNDLGMRDELHIGPYRGRDPELWRATKGIIANGMELFEASKIPLATVADYLRDPLGYEPEVSWRAAIRDVVGEADADAFTLFADNVRSSCLALEDAPSVDEALSDARFELAHGPAAAGVERLDALAGRMVAAADHLLRGPVANPRLIDEVRPWLETFEIGAHAIARVAELAVAGRLADDGPGELGPFLLDLRRARMRVFGDVMEKALSALSGSTLRPGERP